MPMIQCSACLKPEGEREEINRMLGEADVTLATIATRFGLSVSALDRHRRFHLPSQLAVERAAREVEPFIGTLEPTDGDALSRVRTIEARLGIALRAAESLGQLELVPRLARELLRCVELTEMIERRSFGRPSNERAAEDRGAVAALSELVLRALTAHPEARESVAAALVARVDHDG